MDNANLLGNLFVKYGTDKGIWGYTPVYEEYFERRRMEVKRVLEIGICGHRDIPNNVIGASLFVWRDYFPNAEIIGIDNDGRWMVHGEERIKTFCCDVYNRYALAETMVTIGPGQFDMIVDDAVHDPIPQINLLNDLMPDLAPDGVYMMEDVCPYKLPHNDLTHMMRHFPANSHIMVYETPKPERLITVSIKQSLGSTG